MTKPSDQTMDPQGYRVPAPGEAADPVRTPAECAELATRRKTATANANRATVNRQRWRTLNAFADDRLAHVGPAAGAVWLVLFRFAKADGTAFASLPILRNKTGMTRHTIQRAVKRLVDAGALDVIQRGGGAVATVYRENCPAAKGSKKRP